MSSTVWLDETAGERVRRDDECKIIGWCQRAAKAVVPRGTPNGEDIAADISQGVMEKILSNKKLRTFLDTDAVPDDTKLGMLRTVARNLLRDGHRRWGSRAKPLEGELSSKDEHRALVETRLDVEDFVDLLRTYLTFSDRRVFDYFRVQDTSCAVAGAALGMTEKAVRQARTRINKEARTVRWNQWYRRNRRLWSLYDNPPVDMVRDMLDVAPEECEAFAQTDVASALYLSRERGTLLGRGRWYEPALEHINLGLRSLRPDIDPCAEGLRQIASFQLTGLTLLRSRPLSASEVEATSAAAEYLLKTTSIFFHPYAVSAIHACHRDPAEYLQMMMPVPPGWTGRRNATVMDLALSSF